MISKSMVVYGIVIILSLLLQILGPASSSESTDEYIKGMTLEEKVGQLMMIGIHGSNIEGSNISHIRKIRPGGIVLYTRNFRDSSVIRSLVEDMRSSLEGSGLPLFFAIDQEGGTVHRIEEERYKPPSSQAVAAAGSTSLAEELGLSLGTSLRELGINVNFAPVLDMPEKVSSSMMTVRSYGNDPATVAAFGAAYIKGLNEAGVMSTAKHFPGISRADEDTHLKLPRIKWRTNKESEGDLLPFVSAIRSGVDIIMAGHVIAEPGDETEPVSLSRYWLTDFLRGTQGFRGLVIIDNIEMKAVGSVASMASAAVRSFKAGADIIMVSHEMRNQDEVFTALRDAVKKGDISLKRLDESVARIILAKERFMNPQTAKRPVSALKDVSGLILENSVIFLGKRDAPPLHADQGAKVLFVGYSASLLDTVRRAFTNTQVLNTPLSGFKSIYRQKTLPDFIGEFGTVIIDSDYPDSRAIAYLCKKAGIYNVVLLRHPRLIEGVIEKIKPDRIVMLTDDDRRHVDAAMDVIKGIRQPVARLPFKVKLPNEYAYYGQLISAGGAVQ